LSQIENIGVIHLNFFQKVVSAILNIFSGKICFKNNQKMLFPPEIPDIWQDIRPDTWVDNYIFGKISNKFIKIALTIIDFRQTLNNA
jgi:hypothetical protein